MSTTTFQMELPFLKVQTYLWAGAFIAANILFPQLFHAIPAGGKIFLPLFFFTLIASARFGWKAGLLTAIISPLISCAFFGMPPVAALPALCTKSVILSGIAALFFRNSNRFHWYILALTIVAAQALGFLTDAFIFCAPAVAWETLSMSWPGLLLQLVGGGVLLRLMERRSLTHA